MGCGTTKAPAGAESRSQESAAPAPSASSAGQQDAVEVIAPNEGSGKKAIAPDEGSGKKDVAPPVSGHTETLAPPEQPAGNASHAKDQAGFAKGRGRFSMASEDSINKLQKTNEDLTQMETRINEIADLVGTSQVDALGALKSELAQLESKAKQLEGTGVDDIYTGDLHSGKDSAKDLKRNMLRRFEALYEKVDTIFAEIKKAQQT
mmetsp:Transcript_45632/g.80249  ORF Transcript_45632/g.80249 Transcript_45632/m.80249 type:complete len:206 (+) Transcript_45632:58-675(+)